MDIRMTVGTRTNAAVANMRKQTSLAGILQNQIASGKKVERPSDAPADFVTLIDYKARDQRFVAFKESINDSTAMLNDGVNHLNEVQQSLTRAHSLASEGANASTDDRGLEAIATQIDSLIDRVLEISNAKTGGKYLFSGTSVTTQPFEVTGRDSSGRPLGITYRGADERSKALIAPGTSVDTIYAGNRVFQEPGNDVFGTLLGLRDDLRNPALNQGAKSQAINQRLGQIETIRERILNSVGEQSSALNNLEALGTRIDDVRVNVQGRIGELEGTDFAEASVRFQEQNNAFQATLAVTAKIFDPGLLEFIR